MNLKFKGIYLYGFIVLSSGFEGSLFARQSQKLSENVTPVNLVNVFLGTSGDHGQLSPAASYPFSMLSIGAVTYPLTHTGYEYLAKEYLGFTHNRLEGVGCQGSGGNILIKPYMGEFSEEKKLIKESQEGQPGFYKVTFDNGIESSFAVFKKSGIHHYSFPKGKKGFYIGGQ